jgi:phosphatidylglycerol:prolipoprotein diacylglycerol transferase
VIKNINYLIRVKLMFIFPAINPIALSLGPLHIRWYGIMYVVGFVLAWWLARLRSQKPNSQWTQVQIIDLICYAAVGVIIGGRLGSMLFYNLPEFLANPLTLFKIWQPGMSFHGGFIGVLCALWIYSKRLKKSFTEIADFTVPLVPLGLAAGRIGNFINGELWGRVTDMPWGMVYPHVDNLPRHPSQIYEFFLEGILLFIIIWVYSAKSRPPFAVASMFLLCYGVFRTIAECFRQPDAELGFIAFNWLSMGQLLSIPMVIAGVLGLYYTYSKQARIRAIRV